MHSCLVPRSHKKESYQHNNRFCYKGHCPLLYALWFEVLVATRYLRQVLLTNWEEKSSCNTYLSIKHHFIPFSVLYFVV